LNFTTEIIVEEKRERVNGVATKKQLKSFQRPWRG